MSGISSSSSSSSSFITSGRHHEVYRLANSDQIVVPGEPIPVLGDYLRGHGTYNAPIPMNEDHHGGQNKRGGTEADGEGGGGGARAPAPGRLLASLAGCIERQDRLVSVRPARRRYVGEVGDVVVGRIHRVGAKAWRVEVGARQLAVLQLSGVTLPGGAQRRRTQEDQLQMRAFLCEGDLLSAEVQTIYQRDGTLALHTRSLKYGRLANGTLVRVPPSLIKRLKHHFVSLRCGVDLVLGRNGFIWITESDPLMAAAAKSRDSELMQRRREQFAARKLGREAREKISRVGNCVALLREDHCQISPDTIMELYDLSLEKRVLAGAMMSSPLLRRKVLL